MGYDILINVANWPEIRARHWKTFLRSRAIENQAYCIGVNRIGIDGRSIIYSGDSAAFDYDGHTLACLGNTEGIITAILNKGNLTQYRKDFPFLNDMD